MIAILKIRGFGMTRLKGLDEFPDKSPFELSWKSSRISTHGDESESRYTPLGRHPVLITIAAIVIAVIPVWLFTSALDPLLTPTGKEIREEAARRNQALENARENGGAGLVQAGVRGYNGAEYNNEEGSQAFYQEAMGIAFPKNGQVDWNFTHQPGLPLGHISFTDSSGNGHNKAIRFKSLNGNDVWATLYLQSSQFTEIWLPPGGYSVSIADGPAWHGQERQFGDEGHYYQPQPIDVRYGHDLQIEIPSVNSPEGGIQLQNGRQEDF